MAHPNRTKSPTDTWVRQKRTRKRRKGNSNPNGEGKAQRRGRWTACAQVMPTASLEDVADELDDVNPRYPRRQRYGPHGIPADTVRTVSRRHGPHCIPADTVRTVSPGSRCGLNGAAEYLYSNSIESVHICGRYMLFSRAQL